MKFHGTVAVLGAFLFRPQGVMASICQDFIVPVDISAVNSVFDFALPTSSIDVTNLMINLSRQGSYYPSTITSNTTSLSGIFKIAVTYCRPNRGHSDTIQVLTHGISFDRSYWDYPFHGGNYSYMKTAVDDNGFSTLAWDRFGIGNSQHADPLATVQSPLELAALKALTEILRSGSFGPLPSFSKVVHVGHSFGSILSYGLARDNPELSDGLVLTGFSQNGSFIPLFFAGSNMIPVSTSLRAGQYEAGYLMTGAPMGHHITQFGPGDFDPTILDYVYKTAQPVAVGELLTLGQPMVGLNKFAGPVLIITGERDAAFCGSDCRATGDPSLPSIPDACRANMPDANPFEAIIVPKAGHALNLGYSHDFTYKAINEFLTTNVPSAVRMV
ncbi:unnamed protein product [Clonostachys byssicola]|uniref:AB hydrolase-1 domain-containing protein n=1 Tax=Clonostachys byssicola TaxID=160290 RepID=A0A9N9UCH8_9HYPO|nr:unnamed protein product [Clonostachys byssicola]